ncbi:putative DNA-directed RNA polymerase I subunit RPA2 [Neoconidiobolus thromboides FSU 785]|nr:putative DNA-directed RNA polymerase I subunit RPA2 [Neoconidiobolus thromboides FSU 785]
MAPNTTSTQSDNFQYPDLQTITRHHIEGFNNIFTCDRPNDTRGILDLAIKNIRPKIFYDGSTLTERVKGNRIKIWIENVSISRPVLSDREKYSSDRLVYPSECRERRTTYAGAISAKLCYQINDGPIISEPKILGQAPIMIKSSKCNLYKFGPKKLVSKHEESEEMGGYFIINGIEKIIRLLIAPRRNIVTLLVRPSFSNRGSNYSNYGAVIRCVRDDETSSTITVHYLTDGNCVVKFYYRKQEYLVPAMIVLKAFLEVSDKDIFDAIVKEDIDNSFLIDRVEVLLRSFKEYNVFTNKQCLEYLASKFRVVMDVDDGLPLHEIGKVLLKDLIFVHLNNNLDKFNLLIHMISKLYALAAGKVCADNPDSPQFHEVLLGGQLYNAILKERIDDYLNNIKIALTLDHRRKNSTADIMKKNYINTIINRINSDIGSKLHFFLATGNLVSKSGLDQMQVAGYVIAAEKLNFLRYISHFQCIHRGAFFAELKTTSVRKLLPEAWGFLCPVHTPDGSPCGLLNHLAHKCHIVTRFPNVNNVLNVLVTLGVTPITSIYTGTKDSISVQLDGKLIGYCNIEDALLIAKQLRKIKINGSNDIPLDLEIGYIPPSNGGQYPGLYLFSSPSRMTRPVKYIENGKQDIIGPFEQVYMEIACMKEDIVPGITTHIEYTPTNILSVVANLTPFSDFNQSPRNMYQCQMGKQTMGTPAQALKYRTDNKLYRLQTGQSPIVRPKLHNNYALDEFPNGTNAVVCVISYTGYDMEDAMILNKSSHERGFGYGTVYKTEVIDLEENLNRGEVRTAHFGFAPGSKVAPSTNDTLDKDGLPFIGAKLTTGSALYAVHNHITNKTKIIKYKSSEDAIIDDVILTGSPLGNRELTKLIIKFRVPRSPIIGDKFSSRHGQKGVCSQKWPAIDMPFSESGIQPDIIINPHAFPSRMTIGMFVESMAGKAGALHGLEQDATPFTFNEKDTATDYFGEQLIKAGYNYYGNEPMYSGITGEEFKVDIYLGVVYYQRLRHMVSDKYQVRATGPVHALTQQPIKGRKRAGGIRFGEMERDSLLAHGVSFLLQDRLMNCSDYSQVYVCRTCGSFLSTLSISNNKLNNKRHLQCRTCLENSSIDLIAIPYVFRFLATELMAMNIKLNLAITE